MATRKRKKITVNESLSLFSEEEMAGKIENVTIVQSPTPAIVDIPSAEDKEASTPSLSEETFNDERMVEEMVTAMQKMEMMDESHIRLIALTSTMMGQEGLDLNKAYQVPAVRDTDLTGYELAAWCYCSFMHAFPQMKDKLQMPYETHYEKAKAKIK